MKNHLLIIVALLSFYCVRAQDDLNPTAPIENIPSSPEVAELGKYGAVPVNKYTGMTQVSIPLYELNFDGLKIPISLSYNSGGVRADQDATWVGLGWNLQANPSIQRVVNGGDDLANSGYIYIDYEAQYPAGVQEAFLTEQDASLIYQSYIPGSHHYDLEPDIFEVSLFGQNYKFRLRKLEPGATDIEAFVFNNKNVRIIFDEVNKTFEILDENGFKYQFNTKDVSTTFNSNTFECPTCGPSDAINENNALLQIPHHHIFGTGGTVTAWTLDKIISPLANELDFNYVSSHHLTFPSYSSRMRIKEYQGLVINRNYQTNTQTNSVFDSELISASTTVIQNNYLESINGNFGVINFIHEGRKDLFNVASFATLTNRTNGWYFIVPGANLTSSTSDQSKRLDKIELEAPNGDLVKTFDFDYGYFNSHKVSASDKERYLRLKLDRVNVEGKEYEFEYESANNLPAKDTRSVDFWGYYNGANNNGRLPHFNRFFTTQSHHYGGNFVNDPNEVFIDYRGASRNSDFNYGKYGILTKISYPTKGYTNFEYEAHDAYVKKPDPYQVVATHPNGDTKLTNLISEKDYRFTYQYLKKAQDPSYVYFDNVYEDPAGNSDLVETVINLNQQFTVNQPTLFTASSEFVCHTSCMNVSHYASYPLRSLIDVNSGQTVEVIFTYGDGPSAQNSTSNESFQTTLPSGTYKVVSNSLPYDPDAPGWPAIQVLDENTSAADAYKIYIPDGSNPDVTFPAAYETFEIGGARIKSITNYDHNGSFASKKTYDYHKTDGSGNDNSTGKLMDELLFSSKAYGYYSYTPEEFGGGSLMMSSNSTLRNMASAQGSHIGYSFITERDVDSQGNANGRIETTYTNLSNEYHVDDFCRPIYNSQGISGHNPREVCKEDVYILGIAPKEFSYTNGNVIKEEVISESGILLSRTHNTYKLLGGYEDSKFHTRVMPLYPYFQYYWLHRYYYTYRVANSNFLKSVLESSTTTRYLDGGEVNSFSVNSHNTDTHHMISSSQTVENGEEIITKYYYPYDNSVYNLPQINTLRNENRIAIPVKKEVYQGTELLASQLTNYIRNSTTFNRTLPHSIQVQKGSLGTSLPNEVRLKYEKYGPFGKIRQYRQENGIPVAYIWGYNREYIVAKVENATYAQVEALQYFGSNFDLGVNGLNNNQQNSLRNNLPDAMVTTYVHKPLVGVISITDPKGYTTSFEYDDFNRLKAVRDADGNLISENDYHFKGQLD